MNRKISINVLRLVFAVSFFYFAYILVPLVFAASEAEQFGGEIVKTNKKTTEIENLVKNGYDCPIKGTVVEVKPKSKSVVRSIKRLFSKPKIFIINPGVKSSTQVSKIKTGQEIFLESKGTGTITCTDKLNPPNIKKLTYPSVTLYGNSPS